MDLKKHTARALEVAIVVLWLAVLGVAASKMSPQSQKSSAQTGGIALLEAIESDDAEWMGVFMDGQKIGAALSDQIATKDGYKIQERSYLKIRAFERDTEITTAFVAETNKAGQLQRFNFYLSAPPVRTDVVGEVQGNTLSLEISSVGDRITKEITLPEGPPEIALTFKQRAVANEPSVGTVIEMPYFDPATLGQRVMAVTVIETGEIMLGGETKKTYTLEASFQGFGTRSLVTEDGITLEETGALGMTLKRGSRQEVLFEGWGDKTPPDIIALSIIPVLDPIPNARTLKHLKVRLTGGGVEALIAEAHPSDSLGNKGSLTINQVDIKSLKPPMLPIVAPEFTPYLAATSTIQSDDEDFKNIASRLIDDSVRSDLAAKILLDFVFQRLEKVPTMGIPNAKEVLKVGQGDCNEHTILYTALARAAGLPTRIVAGIVYSDTSFGGQGFLYHAWPEVFLGEWVAIDPTFGQFPADATHIKLVEGDLDQQVSMIRVVGNLDIDILEAK